MKNKQTNKQVQEKKNESKRIQNKNRQGLNAEVQT